MGCVSTIDINNFPKQSDKIGSFVKVVYNYNTNKCEIGKIVRDDMENPFVMIIKIDERFILSSECQYQFL